MSALSFIVYKDLYSWDVKNFLKVENIFKNNIPVKLFGDFLTKANIKKIDIVDNKTYKILGVRSYGKGVYVNRVVKGDTLKMRKYQLAKKDHLFWCKVDTKNGAFGIITDELSDGIASSNMIFAEVDTTKIYLDYLQLLFRSVKINSYMDSYVTGTTNRKYIKFDELLKIKIPLPLPQQQEEILKKYNAKIELAKQQEQEVKEIEDSIEEYLFEELGIEKVEAKKEKSGLQFVEFKTVYEWGVDKILGELDFSSTKYDTASFAKNENLFVDIFRGKSPKYKANTKAIILNQKCNRWNEIQLEYAKTVDEEWFEKIDKNFFTKENDILINSTGEGTIGRASNIYQQYSNFIYDSHLLLLRLNHSLVNSEYFVYLFNSSYGQQQVDKIKSAQATKQTELGVNNLKKIVFPLPSLNIQEKIAKKITKRKEKIKQLKQEAQKNREEAIKEFEREIFDEN